MHDTILLEKIAHSVKELCSEYGILRVKQLIVGVSTDSHVTDSNLFARLSGQYTDLFGEWTEISIRREAIEEQTAVIYSLVGESGEKLR